MNIWCINPWVADAEGERTRIAQLPADALDKGTVITFVRTAHQPLGRIETMYELAIMEMEVIAAGLNAETAGCDAVVVDSISDPGVAALRSRLRVPVVGAGATSYLLAGLLGRRFSVVTYLREHAVFYERVLAEQGVRAECASLRPIGEDPNHSALLDGPSEKVRLIERAARAAIEDDGADVIVLGSTSMHRATDRLRTSLPAPVIDPATVSFKLAEALVRLGLSHSKLGLPLARCAPRRDLVSWCCVE